MRVPSIEFTFKLLAERPTRDGLDDRLFAIARLPIGTIDVILSLLRFAGPPASPVWVPRWGSADASEVDAASRGIETAARQAAPMNVVLRSSDLLHFLVVGRLSKRKEFPIGTHT